jgi:hypothetical protein
LDVVRSPDPRRRRRLPSLHRRAREPSHPTPPLPSPSSRSSSAFTAAPRTTPPPPLTSSSPPCRPLGRYRRRVHTARPSPPCPGTVPSSRLSLPPRPPVAVRQTLSLSLSHSLCKFHFVVFRCLPI